jgi:class 3 adenylate cyclase
VPTLSEAARARLPDSAFAYIDSQGRRRLPIPDASHVRNALARFDQVGFEDDAARERARERLLRAAKKYGIVPLGFFDGQLRKAKTATVHTLPRGTVTFLLTDIEGSTRLVERLGDAYPPLLREVRNLIRASVRAASGLEVDARADEFFAVFRKSVHALDAALAIQRGLHAKSWQDGIQVRVRIADPQRHRIRRHSRQHCGACVLGEPRRADPAVVRGARLLRRQARDRNRAP